MVRGRVSAPRRSRVERKIQKLNRDKGAAEQTIPTYKSAKVLSYTFVSLCVLDLITNALLYAAQHNFVVQQAWHDLQHWPLLLDFTHSVADLLLLSIVRVLLLVALCALGVFVGSEWRAMRHIVEKRGGGDADESRRPLLINVDNNDDDDDDAADDADVRIRDIVEVEDHLLGVRNGAKRRKIAVHAVTFVLLMACEVFCGVKAIVIHFAAHHSHGVYVFSAAMLTCVILWISLELFVARALVDRLCTMSGELLPRLHMHPLYYAGDVASHWCDLCMTRIELRRAYRCGTCDFDCCLACKRKADRSKAEGVIRGDKGVRVGKDGAAADVSLTAYARRGLTFARGQWALLSMAMLLMLVASGANMLLPNFQGRILDRVIAQDAHGFQRDVTYFVSLSATLAVFGGIRNFLFSLAGRRMSFDVRNRLFSSIIAQDIAYFDGTKTGDLTSRLTGDVYSMLAPLQSTIASTLSNVVAIVGGLSMCMVTSWRLSLLAFTTISPIVFLYRIYAMWSRKINKEIYAALGDANSVATDAIGAIRTVRTFGTEPRELRAYRTSTAEALRLGVRDSFFGAGTYGLTRLIDLGVGVLLLFYGGTVVMRTEAADGGAGGGGGPLDDGLSVGALITFQLYFSMINGAYKSLANVMAQFTRASGAAARVLELMMNEPDIALDSGVQLDVARGDVEFDKPDNPVLQGVSFRVRAGQTIALVGKSGGGKSTILSLLLRFYDVKQGRVLVDGRDIREYAARSLRAQFGVVAQDTSLFNATIEENIAYGVERYTQQELREACARANALEFIEAFEEGFETRVGERGVRLSGGQRQRIGIARVMLRRPRILLLDEATSSLDATAEEQVQRSIDALLGDGRCTIFLVAHRLSTVVNASLICVVDDGRIVESGTHAELLALNGRYDKLVARQLVKQANQLDLSIDDLIEEEEEGKEEEGDNKKKG